MKLNKICKYINKECKNDIEISNLATLKEAKRDSLSFFHNSKYIEDLKTTKAGAVILKEEDAFLLPKEVVAIISQNPYEDMAKVTSLFKYIPTEKSFSPTLQEGARIAKSANFGKNVVVGKNSLIMAGSFIGDNVKIGDNTIIYPNVVIYYNCKIGNNCIIHSGTIIGSDGFGFAQETKFYQIGNVVVEDDVEIGANCTIDRAALGSTKIKSGVKMDNLIQVGHNCEIGEYSIIVSQVGLSGSTILGKGVVMGGQSATAGHLKIGDKAIIAARGGITKSLEGNKTYGGFPAVEIKLWRKMQAALMRLVKKKSFKT